MESAEKQQTVPENEVPSKRHQSKITSLARTSPVDKQSSQHNSENKIPTNNQGKENSNLATEDQLEQKLCFECNRSLAKSRHLINIAGQFHKWHPECFRCHICNHSLESESSCHIYKDKILCRNDYAQLQRNHSIKCTRCRWPIAASDWVRKAGNYVYHLACFSCDICKRQLSTGEQFTIDIQEKESVRLLCRIHFAIDQYQRHREQSPQQPHLPPVPSCTTASGAACELSFVSKLPGAASPPAPLNVTFEGGTFGEREHRQQHSLKGFRAAEFDRNQYLHLLAAAGSNATSIGPIGAECANKHSDQLGFDGPTNLARGRQLIGHPNCQQPNLEGGVEMSQNSLAHRSGAVSSSSSSNSSSTTSHLMAGGGGHPSKSKRVRTTFTEDQLSILQTHFQIESNPDGQDLERIAIITGLSKRVTQVWFQNSRARQKKYMIKRKPSSTSAGSIGGHAVIAGGALGLAAGGSASLQSSNHLFMNPSHPAADQSDVTSNEETYRRAGSFAALGPEKYWQADSSDRSELSLDEQAAFIDEDLDDDSSNDSDEDRRDREEVANEMIVSEEEENPSNK